MFKYSCLFLLLFLHKSFCWEGVETKSGLCWRRRTDPRPVCYARINLHTPTVAASGVDFFLLMLLELYWHNLRCFQLLEWSELERSREETWHLLKWQEAWAEGRIPHSRVIASSAKFGCLGTVAAFLVSFYWRWVGVWGRGEGVVGCFSKGTSPLTSPSSE